MEKRKQISRRELSYESPSESQNSESKSFLGNASSKLISKESWKETNYEGEPVYCFCGLKAPRWTSWTELNPGRRFYGCPQFNDNGCKFHAWHDPQFTARSRYIILLLRDRERKLVEELSSARAEVNELREEALEIVGTEILEEREILRNEISTLKAKLSILEATCSSGGRSKKKIVLFFGFLVICWVIMDMILLGHTKRPGTIPQLP